MTDQTNDGDPAAHTDADLSNAADPSETDIPQRNDPVSLPKENLPVIVGIGASAGGLEAASLLVQNLPKDVGAAYVLAQHMSPNHKSLLSSLISRETHLPVIDLTKEDVIPTADTIYISQPNSDVVLENGKLGLRKQSGHHATPKPSADRLFNTLAQEMGERCVGVVLSGTGSDGSYGVQAIREAGGITIAQDVGTAKYDGMPASAVETGCVDLQLSPQQIGQHLAKIMSAPRDLDRFRRLNDEPTPLSDLMHILLARTGVDFRDYKENTVNRRIARRMTALGIESYDQYVEHCRASSDEVDALHKDLLISVTRFFRDYEQFEMLGDVLRAMADRKGEDPIRVWVAGCATGEEAYSIAILTAEALGGPAALARARVQIFATDIDARALEVGRAGIYPMTALGDVPEAYVEK
ncbi:MAG: chemotaxis protein CheB, partial [Pseudomonadota bacterium]